MLDLIDKASVTTKTGYWGPAEILGKDESGRRFHIRIPGTDQNHEIWAWSAIPYPYEPHCGEIGLVAGQTMDDLYLIGALTSGKPSIPPPGKVTLRDGSFFRVINGPQTENVQLCSPTGDLLIEYESGKTRIHIGTGDLEFIAPEGNINFTSGQNIRFLSNCGIEMRSRGGIWLTTVDIMGKILSSVSLRSRRLGIKSPEMSIVGRRSEVRIEEVKYIGKTFSSTFEKARFFIGKLEICSNDIIQKTKNIYTKVEGLSQLTAQRMKSLIYSTYHFKSRKAFLRADEDFKINAEKIDLG